MTSIYHHRLAPCVFCFGFIWLLVGQQLGAQTENSDKSLPAFHETCFAPFNWKRGLPQIEDLRSAWEVVVGQPQGLLETKTRLGVCGAVEGIVRLKESWSDHHVLRFALEDYNRLQIHLFCGERGVTLVYHEQDLSQWTGYITERKSDGVTPVQWFLAATDNGRNRRTTPKNHDHYELRCRNGLVSLTRGDIMLVQVPLGGTPDDIFLQGKASFHGFAISKTGDFPFSAPAAAYDPWTLPLESWSRQLDEGARLTSHADGALRLEVATPGKRRSWMARPISRAIPSEVVLEITDASPGAGIYLGNGKDSPRHVLRYVTDRRSQQICMLVRADDETQNHEFRNLTEQPLPAVAPRHWVKLLLGAGQIRWWISPDGVHWAEPTEPLRNVTDVTHVGLHCVSQVSGITLRQMSRRELPALASLAPRELREQAVAFPAASSVGNWLTEVTEVTPAGVSSSGWRRACALRTLAAGCPRTLGNELLSLLLDDDFTRQLATDQQLDVLRDASLLADVWDDNAFLQRLAKRYHEVGQSAHERTDEPAFSSIRRALMVSPLATRHQPDVAAEELIRLELLQWVCEHQWERVREFTQMLRFFQWQAKTPLVDWAESIAVRRLPPGSWTDLTIEKQREGWRDLLIEEVSKDVYNVLAQLRVELGAGDKEEAAKVVVGVGTDELPGVAPHWLDDDLLVSLPTAIRSALGHDSALRRLHAERNGPLAELRLRQAMAENQEDAVFTVAVQFPRTSASFAALTWLADRALVSGRFIQAADFYAQAQRDAPEAFTAEFASRMSLAQASLGMPASPPANGKLQLDGKELPPDEAAKVWEELSQRAAPRAAIHTLDTGLPPPDSRLPKPSGWNAHKRVRLDGPIGNDPNREFAREVNRRQLDWVGRQLGVVVDAHHMLVSNRFQLAAYDLQSKQRLWQTPAPAGQIQFAQESTFTASRPLLSGERIYLRLLYGAGGTLACVQRSNGEFKWTAQPSPNEEWISDPLWLGGELACFKLFRNEQQELLLQVAWLDDQTGFTRREQDVVRLRDVWRKRRYCEFTALPQGVVAALGGVLVRIDHSGRVLWIRKQTTLPADEMPAWVTQHFQKPLFLDGRLFVFQPGVGQLICVDADTGEQVWLRLFSGLERLIGLTPERLLCQTSQGITALHPGDGKTVWSHAATDLTVGVTCDAQGNVLYVQRAVVEGANNRFRPRMAWLDGETGTPQGTTSLPELEQSDPRLGPLVLYQDRLWTFFGNGPQEANRDVIELEPGGAADSTATTANTDLWTRHVDPRVQDAATRALGGWQVLQAAATNPAGTVPEFRGEKDVLALRYHKTDIIALGRELSLPANTSPRLRLRFGNDPSQAWKLEVRFGGETIWSQEVQSATHPEPWKSVEMNVSQLAGKQGWLTIRAEPSQGGDVVSYWKTLEIVF